MQFTVWSGVEYQIQIITLTGSSRQLILAESLHSNHFAVAVQYRVGVTHVNCFVRQVFHDCHSQYRVDIHLTGGRNLILVVQRMCQTESKLIKI